MRKIRGKASEDKVEAFLKNRGFRVLARNYRKIFGEIDLVVERDEEVWFLEVKTANRNFPAIDKLNERKISRMLNVARMFMEERNLNLPSRFFLVEVGEDIRFMEIDAW